MKTRKLFAVVAVVGLLASCAQNPHSMDMTELVQNAKTHDDHEMLAKHYEDAAKEMQTKVDKHKKLLEQYNAKISVHGKQAQNLKDHCATLIQAYQQAADINMNMANAHHQIAAETR